jgi:mRNA-degrading endonuclease RelE of RelBE toxin-antitoxin system
MSFFFRKKPDDKPSVNIIFSPSANEEANNLPLQCQLRLSDAIAYLQHTRFREEKKTNLYLTVDGNSVWSLPKGNVRVAYYTEGTQHIYIVWVSIISKFRQ